MEQLPELTAREASWREVLRQPASGACLEAEVLLDIARRGRRARQYLESLPHLAECHVCFETLAALRALPSRSSQVWLWLVPALAAGAVAAVLLLNSPKLDSLKRPGRIAATRNTEPVKDAKPGAVPRPRIVEVRPQVPKVLRRASGLLAMSDGSLTEGGLKLPAWAKTSALKVFGRASSYRGADGTTLVRVTIPPSSDSSLLARPRTVRWSKVEGATGYEVILAINGTGKKATVMSPSIIVDSDRSIRTLTVTILPILDSALSPPSNTAQSTRFSWTILNGERLRRARWALANTHKAPVAAMMVLNDLGLVSLAAKVKVQGNSAKVKAWKQAIASAATRSLGESVAE